jgi:hypothetical protein
MSSVLNLSKQANVRSAAPRQFSLSGRWVAVGGPGDHRLEMRWELRPSFAGVSVAGIEREEHVA